MRGQSASCDQCQATALLTADPFRMDYTSIPEGWYILAAGPVLPDQAPLVQVDLCSPRCVAQWIKTNCGVTA